MLGVIKVNNPEFILSLNDLDKIVDILRQAFLILASYYIYIKVFNISKIKAMNNIIMIVSCIIFAVLTIYIEYYTNSYYSILLLLFFLVIINKINFSKNIIQTILVTAISYGINYAIYVISVIVSFVPISLLGMSNDYMSLLTIIAIYLLIISRLLKWNKIKYGIVFLQKKIEDSYFNMLILNISVIILFLEVIINIIPYSNVITIGEIIAITAFIIFITIYQSFDLYYKQKQLIKDYEETKAELEKEKKEKQEIKNKILKDSKARHSVVYKQDSLEEKMDKILQLDSISEDEKERLKVEFGKISDEVYKGPGKIELTKTDISLVDDMLEHMQTKCIKNKIDFELQIVGDIHYMVNHLVTEDELRILLADHIKDAIIAINSSDNTNRSIMVRLGKIDNVYSVYIYDSGVEFKKEVLDKLGKEPITTHEDTGGTGMGFMNTFDLLKKYNASLTIKEIGIPTKDNYTKVLMFKFDNQGEFKVESYKNENLTVQKS